ncbi:(Fe-S)-binding protein [uncultured Thiodictyon sp.]|uniref:(Fe-S)-binding protein n=1 Tax=uncultured Thiodictyon sp. TaxID=1846217 RepID=UPI0025F74875|nr:(Fe-S)-binding protein [uncultured Thiodictyon sp.]
MSAPARRQTGRSGATPGRSATRIDVSPDQLLTLADQCVKCGLCLPHCPTFMQLRNEADSPRGRIALIQGWASGELAMSPTLAGHLGGCLGCRACEDACPSLVAYGQLIDGAKAARLRASPAWRQAWRRLWLGRLADAHFTGALARAAALYERTGVARLAQRCGLAGLRGLRPLHRLARAITKTAAPVPGSSDASADVELFVGCMGGLAQGRAVAAARTLLGRLGLRVRVPSAPRCCGALHQHNGLPADGQRRGAACARHRGDPPLVGLASACVAELRAAPGSADTQEFCDWLDRLPTLNGLGFRPLERLVLVHEPCSQRQLLGGNAAVYRLLARIPGLTAQPLPGNQTCCGGAGTYPLQQPELADALVAEKLAGLTAGSPDLIVTTNPGCALHLIAGLREAALAIEVCHPVELLARQIK